MDSILSILVAAAMAENMVAQQMFGVTIVNSTRQAIPLALITSYVTAAALTAAVIIASILKQVSQTGQDGLIVPLLLPIIAIIAIAAKTKLPQRYQAVLPLAIANTAILGIPLQLTQQNTNLITQITYAVGSSIGFAIALITICELRQRLWLRDIPKPLHGLPILLLTISGIGMALYGLHT